MQHNSHVNIKWANGFVVHHNVKTYDSYRSFHASQWIECLCVWKVHLSQPPSLHWHCVRNFALCAAAEMAELVRCKNGFLFSVNKKNHTKTNVMHTPVIYLFILWTFLFSTGRFGRWTTASITAPRRATFKYWKRFAVDAGRCVVFNLMWLEAIRKINANRLSI